MSLILSWGHSGATEAREQNGAAERHEVQHPKLSPMSTHASPRTASSRSAAFQQMKVLAQDSSPYPTAAPPVDTWTSKPLKGDSSFCTNHFPPRAAFHQDLDEGLSSQGIAKALEVQK